MDSIKTGDPMYCEHCKKKQPIGKMDCNPGGIDPLCSVCGKDMMKP